MMLIQFAARVRIVVCCFLAAFSCTLAAAQEVSVRQNIIYRAGKPYAQISSNGRVFGYPNFFLKTLQGQEEFMILGYDEVAGDYCVVFLPSNEQTRLPRTYGSLEMVAREVVANNFIRGDTLDPAAVKRFMLAHPRPASARVISARAINSLRNAGYTHRIGDVVNRKFDEDSVRRARPVTVLNSFLLAGMEQIGTYSVKTETRDGQIFRTYVFGNLRGEVVAKATAPAADATSYEVVTQRDKQRSNVPVTAGSQTEVAAALAQWLFSRQYL